MNDLGGHGWCFQLFERVQSEGDLKITQISVVRKAFFRETDFFIRGVFVPAENGLTKKMYGQPFSIKKNFLKLSHDWKNSVKPFGDSPLTQEQYPAFYPLK